jgi:putrescine aminotransferase
MPQNLEEAWPTQVAGEISSRKLADRSRGKSIIDSPSYNLPEPNKGWRDYRKSVTEAGDWAATEWARFRAVYRDVLGREYIGAWEVWPARPGLGLTGGGKKA